VAGDPRQARLDRMFRRGAALYDLQLPLERRALRAAATLAGPVAGARVVDLGSGTGAMAAALARGGRPRDLVLADRVPAMLERARRRVARAAPGVPVRALVADARAVPLADGAADLVTAANLLHLLAPADALAVLREARRLLAPGGRAVLLDHAAPDTPLGRLYTRGWALVARLPGTAQGPQGDVRELVEAAGLAVGAVRSVPGVYWSTVLVAMPEAPPPAA
jgi:ubiquinone/menaquinone biosynthesis C-methylase UbiE